MELNLAIENRRTIHSFDDRKVSEEIIFRAISSANFAPCHKLTYPWRFTLIGYKKRQLIAEESISIKGLGDNMSAQKKKIKSKFLNPSHLIIASQVLDTEAVSKAEDYASCCCAIQNLMLSLTADGVGSKWSTGAITKTADTYKIVEIDPLKEEIIGFIWAGYGKTLSKIRRPSIDSIVRHI